MYVILKLKERKRQNPEEERKLQKMQMTKTLLERSRGQRQIIQKRIKGQLSIMRWRLLSHQLPWIPELRPVWMSCYWRKRQSWKEQNICLVKVIVLVWFVNWGIDKSQKVGFFFLLFFFRWDIVYIQ